MAEIAGDAHLTSMVQDDVLDDGKTQAGPAGFPLLRLVHAVKALKQAGEMFRGNARAKIADEEFDIRGPLNCANLDGFGS